MTTKIEEPIAFGKRLAALRIARGYSQQALATELGVTRRTVCYYECEAKRPPAQLLDRLSQVLGVSIDELLGRENTPPGFDGRSVDARFLKQWRKLTIEQKRAVSKVVDQFLDNRVSGSDGS